MGGLSFCNNIDKDNEREGKTNKENHAEKNTECERHTEEYRVSEGV